MWRLLNLIGFNVAAAQWLLLMLLLLLLIEVFEEHETCRVFAGQRALFSTLMLRRLLRWWRLIWLLQNGYEMSVVVVVVV